MEDQGKRLLLAVVLALGIVVLWNVVFPSKPSEQKKPAATETDAPVKKNSSKLGDLRDGGAAPAIEAPVAEVLIEKDYANLHVAFSNLGGVVSSWRLTEKKYERDPRKGELMVPGRGSFAVNFLDSTVVIPAGAAWTGEELSETEFRYTYRDADIEVVKTFRLYPDDFLIRLSVDVKKLSAGEAKQRLGIALYGQQDPKLPTGGGYGRATRSTSAVCYLGELKTRSARWLHERGPDERAGRIRWLGFNHPFILFAVAPKDSATENLACNMYPVEDVPGGMEVDLVFSSAVLKQEDPGPLHKEMVAYLGPKSLSKLERASELAGFSTGFEWTVDMGWFSFIARPLMSLVTWLYGFTGNWGIAIILLTVLVKLATLYWTTKSMRSMKAMAALKPHMDALQKKHGDDKQKIQQEMMALYKQHGVNPLAGCLPMLLQMPIWLALYQMLSSVGELYLSPFIPGWIDDLTETDPYHILPIVLMGMMFLQSKLSPATLDSMQQKILMYGLPLMFGVMSFFFPSGLTIYIFTNTTLSLLHTLYMKKFDKSAKSPLPPPKVAPTPSADESKGRDGKGAGKSGGKRRPVREEPEVDERDADRDDDRGSSSDDDRDDDRDDNDDDDERPAAKAPVRNVQPQQPRRTNAPRRKRKRGKH